MTGGELSVETTEALKYRLGLLAMRLFELDERIGSDEDGARRSLLEGASQHNAIVHLLGLPADLEVNLEDEDGDE